MAYFMGLDVGGTSVKGLIIDETGKIICEDSTPTLIGEELADCIISLADTLVRASGKVYSQIAGAGVCCPGVINPDDGSVVFAGNLELRDYPLRDILVKKLKIPVKVCNDANGAALGEAKFGAGKGYNGSVLVTLGTGVGGEIGRASCRERV